MGQLIYDPRTERGRARASLPTGSYGVVCELVDGPTSRSCGQCTPILSDC